MNIHKIHNIFSPYEGNRATIFRSSPILNVRKHVFLIHRSHHRVCNAPRNMHASGCGLIRYSEQQKRLWAQSFGYLSLPQLFLHVQQQ